MNKKVLQKLTAITTAAVLAASIAPMGASAAWNKDANANWSWTENGQKSTGWKMIHGNWYHFDGSGVMQTGWKFIDGQWYYMDQSGAMKTGWQFVNGEWYHLGTSGAMTKGWYKEGSTWYHLNENGAMSRNWRKISNKWYHFNPSGQMSTGWINWKNNHYFSSKDGVMQTGLVQIDNKVYYFDEVTGELQTGRIKVGNITYTFGEDGAATGALLPKAEIAFDANGNEKTPGDVISGGTTTSSRPSYSGGSSGGSSSYVEVQSVSLNKTNHIMYVGDDVLLTASIYPSNSTNRTVTWISSDESIATVTNGYVHALKEGTVTIKAIVDTVEATCTVEVMAQGGEEEVKVTGITVSSTSGENSTHVGETLQLEAAVTPTNASNKAVTWSSSNTAVATVDANGLVSGVEEGTAKITATAKDGSGVTGTFDVEITAEPEVEITGYVAVSPVVVEDDQHLTTAAMAAAKLPSQVTLNYEGGTVAVDVTWACDSYDPTSTDAQTFTASYTLPSSYVDAVDSLTVTATVQLTVAQTLDATAQMIDYAATGTPVVKFVFDADGKYTTATDKVTYADGKFTVAEDVAGFSFVDGGVAKQFTNTDGVWSDAVEISKSLIFGVPFTTNVGRDNFGYYSNTFDDPRFATTLTDGVVAPSDNCDQFGYVTFAATVSDGASKDICFNLEDEITFKQINIDLLKQTVWNAADGYPEHVTIEANIGGVWAVIGDVTGLDMTGTDGTAKTLAFTSEEAITASGLRFTFYARQGNAKAVILTGIDVLAETDGSTSAGTLEVPNEVAETPTITTDLAETKTVNLNDKVELAVEATVSDGGTLSYQWYKNGVAIAGATSATYSFTAFSAETATYKVEVTNTKEGMLSSKATSSKCVVTVTSELVNIAKGKTYTFSTSADNLNFANADDGVKLTDDVTPNTDDYTAEGIVAVHTKNDITTLDIVIDLGEEMSFKQVAIDTLMSNNGILALETGSVSYSSDNSTWTELGTIDHKQTDMGIGSILVSSETPVTGRYVKVSYNDSHRWHGLAEIRVWGEGEETPPSDAAATPIVALNQEENLTLKAGDSFYLRANASASDGGALSYQWYKDDEPIEGATEKLIAVTNVDASCVYKVVVTNTVEDKDPATTAKEVNVTVDGKYDNLALNKTYTYTSGKEPIEAYPDTDNKELTDGNIVTELSYSNAGYAAWNNVKNGELVIDLGESKDISKVNVVMMSTAESGLVLQYEVQVQYSNDNATWTDLGTKWTNDNGQIAGTAVASVVGEANARYVKVTLPAKWWGDPDYGMRFVSEVMVLGTDSTTPPVETTFYANSGEYTFDDDTSYSVADGQEDAVKVEGDAVVNITGGTYYGGQTPLGGAGNTAVFALGNAVVNISGGEFTINGLAEGDTGHIDLIYVKENATINISGGIFRGIGENASDVWLVNLKDADEDTAKIVITGGTFVNWNPATEATDPNGQCYIAEGYKVEESTVGSDTHYIVVKDTVVETDNLLYGIPFTTAVAHDNFAGYSNLDADPNHVNWLTDGNAPLDGSWGDKGHIAYAASGVDDADLTFAFGKEITFRQITLSAIKEQIWNPEDGIPDHITIVAQIDGAWKTILDKDGFDRSASKKFVFATDGEAITATGLKFYLYPRNGVAAAVHLTEIEALAAAGTAVDGTLAVLAIAETPVLSTNLNATEKVAESGAATLTVEASVSDGGSLSYQWYKNGVEISGATEATYTIASAAAEDTASYYCVVKNTLGDTNASVESKKCYVTVYKEDADNLIAGKSFTSTTADGNYGFGYGPSTHPEILDCLTDGFTYEPDRSGNFSGASGLVCSGGAGQELIFDLGGLKEFSQITLNAKHFDGLWGATLRMPGSITVEVDQGTGTWASVYNGTVTATGSDQKIVLGADSAISASKVRITWTKAEGSWGTAVDEVEIRVSAPEGVTDGTMTAPVAPPVVSSNLISGKEWTSTTVESESYGDSAFVANASKWLTDGEKPTPETISTATKEDCGVVLFYNNEAHPVQSFVYDLDAGKNSFKQIQISVLNQMKGSTQLGATPKTIKIEANIGGEWKTIFENAEAYSDLGANKNFVFSTDTAITADQLRFSFVGQGTGWPGVALNEIEVLADAATGAIDGTLAVADAPVEDTAAVPSIDTDLEATKTANVGDEVTFTVVASTTDEGTLSYQWYKDDVAIDGATNATYTIASATAEDAGSYKVVVTNTNGTASETATSTVCALTVETPVVTDNLLYGIPFTTAVAHDNFAGYTGLDADPNHVNWLTDGDAPLDGSYGDKGHIAYAASGAGDADFTFNFGKEITFNQITLSTVKSQIWNAEDGVPDHITIAAQVNGVWKTILDKDGFDRSASKKFVFATDGEAITATGLKFYLYPRNGVAQAVHLTEIEALADAGTAVDGTLAFVADEEIAYDGNPTIALVGSSYVKDGANPDTAALVSYDSTNKKFIVAGGQGVTRFSFTDTDGTVKACVKTGDTWSMSDIDNLIFAIPYTYTEDKYHGSTPDADKIKLSDGNKEVATWGDASTVGFFPDDGVAHINFDFGKSITFKEIRLGNYAGSDGIQNVKNVKIEIQKEDGTYVTILNLKGSADFAAYHEFVFNSDTAYTAKGMKLTLVGNTNYHFYNELQVLADKSEDTPDATFAEEAVEVNPNLLADVGWTSTTASGWLWGATTASTTLTDGLIDTDDVTYANSVGFTDETASFVYDKAVSFKEVKIHTVVPSDFKGQTPVGIKVEVYKDGAWNTVVDKQELAVEDAGKCYVFTTENDETITGDKVKFTFTRGDRIEGRMSSLSLTEIQLFATPTGAVADGIMAMPEVLAAPNLMADWTYSCNLPNADADYDNSVAGWYPGHSDSSYNKLTDGDLASSYGSAKCVGWWGLQLGDLVLTFDNDTPKTFKEIMINTAIAVSDGVTPISGLKVEAKIDGVWKTVFNGNPNASTEGTQSDIYLTTDTAITATGLRFTFSGGIFAMIGEIQAKAEKTDGVTANGTLTVA